MKRAWTVAVVMVIVVFLAGVAVAQTGWGSKAIAQQWLDRNLTGTTAETPDEFYSYCTVHTRKDGKISGVLSVNGYGGAVWHHTWHGPFMTSKEAMG